MHNKDTAIADNETSSDDEAYDLYETKPVHDYKAFDVRLTTLIKNFNSLYQNFNLSVWKDFQNLHLEDQKKYIHQRYLIGNVAYQLFEHYFSRPKVPAFQKKSLEYFRFAIQFGNDRAYTILKKSYLNAPKNILDSSPAYPSKEDPFAVILGYNGKDPNVKKGLHILQNLQIWIPEIKGTLAKIELGIYAFYQKKYSKAMDCLTEAEGYLADYPCESARANAYLALLYFHNGDLPQAVAQLNKLFATGRIPEIKELLDIIIHKNNGLLSNTKATYLQLLAAQENSDAILACIKLYDEETNAEPSLPKFDKRQAQRLISFVPFVENIRTDPPESEELIDWYDYCLLNKTFEPIINKFEVDTFLWDDFIDLLCEDLLEFQFNSNFIGFLKCLWFSQKSYESSTFQDLEMIKNLEQAIYLSFALASAKYMRVNGHSILSMDTNNHFLTALASIHSKYLISKIKPTDLPFISETLALFEQSTLLHVLPVPKITLCWMRLINHLNLNLSTETFETLQDMAKHSYIFEADEVEQAPEVTINTHLNQYPSEYIKKPPESNAKETLPKSKKVGFFPLDSKSLDSKPLSQYRFFDKNYHSDSEVIEDPETGYEYCWRDKNQHEHTFIGKERSDKPLMPDPSDSDEIESDSDSSAEENGRIIFNSSDTDTEYFVGTRPRKQKEETEQDEVDDTQSEISDISSDSSYLEYAYW